VVTEVNGAERLPDRLRPVLGPPLGVASADLAVDNLRRVTHSPSRTTWKFDAVTRDRRHPLILQILEPGQEVNFELQAGAQQAAAELGVPVPRIVAGNDSPEALGQPFLITEMVKGRAGHSDIVAQLDRADGQAGRAALLRQCARALAGIHRIGARTDKPQRPYRLALCRNRLDAPGITSATFEWAYRWLTTHEPPPSPEVLAHGDYRMGNLLVDGTTLTAVLDWEWVHVSEANEDLAWFCTRAWRFGAPASLGAGGLGSIESFLDIYQQASGTTVDPVGFHWWRVMATLFCGILRRHLAQSWLTRQDPLLQLSLLGRQICEIEWDLLNLLDQQPPDDLGAPPPQAPYRSVSPPGWKDLLG
jgi:aminoglycoside phosphotransferase (APT) family kinase protein